MNLTYEWWARCVNDGIWIIAAAVRTSPMLSPWGGSAKAGDANLGCQNKQPYLALNGAWIGSCVPVTRTT